MFLIPDDASLRRFIPNVMATLPGDRTLFERIEPFIVSAELWLVANMADMATLESFVDVAETSADALYHLPRRLVALMAWRSAIPSLDLIVTANGLSAVETKTTKPASKAKIDRLTESLDRDIDSTELSLLGELLRSEDWRRSDIGRKYLSTLFCLPEEIRRLTDMLPDVFRPASGQTTLIDRWLSGLGAVTDAEDTAARLWLSTGVMSRLRRLKPDIRDWYCPEGAVIRMVMGSVAAYLHNRRGRECSGGWPVGRGEMCGADYPGMEEAREIVASHPMRFPEFVGSPQYIAMRTRGHENRRESRGYFF